MTKIALISIGILFIMAFTIVFTVRILCCLYGDRKVVNLTNPDERGLLER